MPFSFSKTGNTVLRDADVQHPITAATLSFTRSFLAFSANVGQSLAPSSTMILIFRPSTPPIALICSMASCSAWMDPVSLMAIVPVAECNWPTVTVSSVTARPVVLTFAVGKSAARMAGAPEVRTTQTSMVRMRIVFRIIFMFRFQVQFQVEGWINASELANNVGEQFLV